MANRPKTYKNFVAPEGGKSYQLTANPDGTSKIVDVTDYIEQGDTWNAADANAIWDAIEESGNITAESISAIPASEKGAANGVASLNADGNIKGNQASSSRTNVTASRNITADDAGKLILCYTNAVTLTIPTGLPINMEIEVCRWGEATVTIEAASGVTIKSTETARTIKNQYGVVCLKKITADEIWLLAGDLG